MKNKDIKIRKIVIVQIPKAFIVKYFFPLKYIPVSWENIEAKKSKIESMIEL